MHQAKVRQQKAIKETYQSPIREICNLAASTPNGKGEHEHHDLSSTVQRGREQEVVFPEPSGTVAPEVVLREDSQAEGGEDGAVNTDAKITKGPCAPYYQLRCWIAWK
jgi:hypothetical protein